MLAVRGIECQNAVRAVGTGGQARIKELSF
jgi:hypothetical protein